MSVDTVAPVAGATSRHNGAAVLPSECLTPGTNPAVWLGRLSLKRQGLARERHRMTDVNEEADAAISAEWDVVTELIKRGATDADCVEFLRYYAVGARMRRLSKNDMKWVADVRRRWNDPKRRQRMVGRQAPTVEALDLLWSTMQSGRWTAFIGFLALSVKAQKACALEEVTCAQREVAAFTGTPGQTVWVPLRGLPFVTMTAKGTVATGSVFAINPSAAVAAAPVAFRPQRLALLKAARHPAVIGGVLAGRLLLTWASVALGGATKVEHVAEAWGITVRTAREWVKAASLTDAIVLAADGTVTVGCSLDELAVRNRVEDAPAMLADRHRDERDQQKARIAARNARREPTLQFGGTETVPEVVDDHAGWIATRFVEAVDAPNVRRLVAVRIAQALIDDLIAVYGDDLGAAIETAWVAGAAVTAWAWSRQAAAPGKVYRKVGPIMTVVRDAIRRHRVGRSDADVIARAARDGARVRRPLTLEQRRARAEADRARRLERSIAREAVRPRPPRPLVAVWPRDWGNVPTYKHYQVAMDVQRRTTDVVSVVRTSGVVEDATLTAAWRRALLDAVSVVDVNSTGAVDAAVLAAVAGLRAGLPGVLVPGPVLEPVAVEPAGDTGIAPVVTLVRRAERRTAA